MVGAKPAMRLRLSFLGLDPPLRASRSREAPRRRILGVRIPLIPFLGVQTFGGVQTCGVWCFGGWCFGGCPEFPRVSRLSWVRENWTPTLGGRTGSNREPDIHPSSPAGHALERSGSNSELASWRALVFNVAGQRWPGFHAFRVSCADRANRRYPWTRIAR